MSAVNTTRPPASAHRLKRRWLSILAQLEAAGVDDELALLGFHLITAMCQSGNFAVE